MTKVVNNGMAVEMTKDEAKARVRRVAEAGLVGNALWIEVEQLVWGFMNSKMTEFFEICFCCPCCCVAQACARLGGRQTKMFLTPSGFTATVDHAKCTACGKCLEGKVPCPEDAISYRPEDGKMVNLMASPGAGKTTTILATIDRLRDELSFAVVEGDDKILKYPLMFSVCDVLIVNKCDYLALPTCNFDMDALLAHMSRLNSEARVFQISSLSGEGVDGWCDYLRKFADSNA